MRLQKNKLGSTDIEVTELCIGTLILGHLQADLTPNEGAKAVQKALEQFRGSPSIKVVDYKTHKLILAPPNIPTPTMDLERLLIKKEEDFKILKDITLIPNFLSPQECRTFISLMNEQNCDKLMFNSQKITSWLWKRLKHHYPYTFISDADSYQWKVCELNDHLPA